MTVRADDASRVVAVDDVLDLEAALAIRSAVLRMVGEATIDLHRVRTVDDSALAYLVTALRDANHAFTLRGLCWPHTKLLDYLTAPARGDPS